MPTSVAAGIEFGVKADFATLVDANFRDADLRGASLAGAVLRGADLAHACFDDATLRHANLNGATIDGTSFANVNFEQADLCGLPLRQANLGGGNFLFCQVCGSVTWKKWSCRRPTSITRYLTAPCSRPRVCRAANFSHARLYGVCLADIDWEGADLLLPTCANARSISAPAARDWSAVPIASEGSRTGFYGDEYDQQTFRPPEEIRKANLCKADLTGAQLANTDFYLVDLRGAKYTPDQFEYLRRCGAILFDKE